MLVKIHKTGNREIISLCDKELVGKIFYEKDLQLNISERFYKGKDLPKNEIKNILLNTQNLNIIGKKSINLALELKIIKKENIKKIKNIPYAFIFRL